MKKHFLIIILAMTGQYAAGQSKEKINILLITGVGITGREHPYHDWSHAHYNDILADALKDVAVLTVTKDLSVLTDKNLKQYDMIMNNSLFMEPSAEQLQAFFKFIESGKSYFAIHAGLVSFLN